MEFQYAVATEKVNEALETVKNDLMKVKNQDDQLMKDLLNINAVIMKLSNRRRKPSVCGQVFCSCGNYRCKGKRIISASDMRKIDSPVSLRNTSGFSSVSLDSNGSDFEYGSSEDEINNFSDSDNDIMDKGNISNEDIPQFDYV